ncbi:MAG: methyltransferase domain-containing protein [Ferruginibacter sp.]|nr:methyltransferase domain-containing protein [Ferruginibacter sp.]
MKIRSLKKEKLDDLSLHGAILYKALQSLAWINKWFGNHRSVIKTVNDICKNESRPVRITDLGCGGGDLAIALAKSLQKRKIQFSITGIDGNNNTLLYAQKKCSSFSEISFIQADILNPGFRVLSCDILMSSHFMYHFTEDTLAAFIINNSPAVSGAFVFSELNRNRLALYLFKFSSFFLPLSKLAKEDGLLAIKRSFTKNEWQVILNKAKKDRYHLRHAFLFRLLVTVFPNNKM